MLTHIPISRRVLYVILLGLLPIFFVAIPFFSKRAELQELQLSLHELQQQALMKEKKQALNIALKNHYRDADHFYIDKHLETLAFLEPEVEALQKIVNHHNFTDDPVTKKRLEHLTNANNLVFSEGVVQSYHFFQETTETLVHPVEVDISDIRKILAKVEGIDVGSYTSGPNRSLLLITDFKIDKKKNSEKNEVFMLNMKLLKREFL